MAGIVTTRRGALWAGSYMPMAPKPMVPSGSRADKDFPAWDARRFAGRHPVGQHFTRRKST
jgi:hypothetical protein